MNLLFILLAFMTILNTAQGSEENLRCGVSKVEGQIQIWEGSLVRNETKEIMLNDKLLLSLRAELKSIDIVVSDEGTIIGAMESIARGKIWYFSYLINGFTVSCRGMLN